MSYLNPRSKRVVAGLAVLSAFAVAPMAAQAADSTQATGNLAGGGLVITAPSIAPFGATLTGVAQVADTTVGGWSLTDARGTNAGYNVVVDATAPTVDTDGAGAGVAGAPTGPNISMTLNSPDAIKEAGNPATAGPLSEGAQLLDAAGVTISTAVATTGQGQWNFAGDVALETSLAVGIPALAQAGDYASTLTYTSAPPA
ncbi:MAG: hypothetical protein QOJ89_525 [bacterium]|jgi:hypothetical protein